MDDKAGAATSLVPTETSARSTNASEPKTYYDPPSWLAEWVAHEPIPVPMTDLRQSLMLCQHALIPATAEAIIDSLEPAIDLFGAPKGWNNAKVRLYAVLLGDIPPDLLARGVFIALRYARFFPWPAEIREPIQDELSRRKDALRRLGTAMIFAEREESG